MLRDSWWWPWWVSSLIDLGVATGALVVVSVSRRRVLKTVAMALVVGGLVAAVLAPIVMTDRSRGPMPNEPMMPGGGR